jgi:hypothetical protein
MTASNWLDELPVLGRLPAEEAAAKLREVGEDELADALLAVRHDAPATTYALPRLRLRRDRAFRHSGLAIGHLAPSSGPHTGQLAIHHAGSIAPDPSLKGERITITLDALYVADYPGRGPHQVLFDFAAQDVHFNTTYRVAEGEHAAVLGRPVFVGLRVSGRGLLLQVATVNVHNGEDEAFLGFLETDVFKAGLQLVSTWQPALGPLSAMALALTKAIATRRRNVVVQTVELGLDFRTGPTGTRLAEGAYIAVQIPESVQTAWRWQNWVYDPTNGHIVNAANTTQLLPYNFFTIGISRHHGT